MTREVTDSLYVELGYVTPEDYYVYVANAQALVAAESTVTCAVSVIKTATVSLTVQSTQTTLGNRFSSIDLFALTDALLTAEATRVRTANISVSTNFDLATDFVKIIAGQSVLGNTFTLNLPAPIRSRQFESNQSAAFSLGGFALQPNVGSSVIKSTSVSLTATSDLLLQTSKILSTEVALTNTFSIVANANKILQGQSSIDASANINANVSRTRDLQSSLSSETTVFAIISHIEGADIVAFANSTTTAQANVIRSTSVSLSSQTNQTADISVNKPAQSTLSLNFELFADFISPSRIVGSPTVNSGGEYSLVEIDTDIKKFGAGSLRFKHPTNFPKTFRSETNYNGTRLLAFTADNQGLYSSFISTNGTTWSKTDLSSIFETNEDYIKIRWINNRYLAWSRYFSGSSSGNRKVFESTNGTTWAEFVAPSGSASTPTPHNYLHDIDYFGGQYYWVQAATTTTTPVGVRIFNNGSSAAEFTSSPQFTTLEQASLAVGGGKIAVTYKLFNNDTQVTTSLIRFRGTGNWSTNFSGAGHDIEYGSNDTWVAVGRQGDVRVSINNGVSFSQVTVGNEDFSSVNYLNNQWIILTTTGKIYTSTDPTTTWTQIGTAPDYFNSNTIGSKISYAYDKYYLAQSSSSDLITWSQVSDPVENSLQGTLTYPDNDSWNSWKTIDFWAYINDTAVSSENNITGHAIGPRKSNSWQIRTRQQFGGANDGWRITQINLWNSSGTLITTNNTVTDIFALDQWHHIRLSLSSDGRLALYLNGQRQIYATGQPTVFQNTSSLLEILGTHAVTQVNRTSNERIRYDEILISDQLLTDPEVTSFTPPTQAYVDNAQHKLLLHFDNNFEDTGGPVVKSFAANLSSSFATSAQANRSVTATATLQVAAATLTVGNIQRGSSVLQSSQFELTVLGARSRIVEASSTTAFTLDLAATRIRSATSSQEASCQLAVVESRLRSGQVSISATADATATALKILSFSITTDSTTALLAALGLVGDFFVNADLAATLSLTAVKTTDTAAALNTNSELTALESRTRPGQADLSTSCSLSASSDSALSATANFETQSQLDTSGQRIRFGQADLSSQGFATLDISLTRPSQIDLSTSLTLSATATVTRVSQADLAVSTDSSTSQDRIRTTAVSIDSALSFTASVVLITPQSIIMASSSQLTTAASRTRTVSGQLSSQGFASLTARATRPGQIDLASTTALTVDATRIRTAQGQIAAIAGLTATSLTVKTAEINISSAWSATVTFRVIHLESGGYWLIDPESRIWTIAPEVRIYTIRGK
jgi:hypothetical protein